jgi:hypothetical protein
VRPVEGERWPENHAERFGVSAEFAGCIWDYTDIGRGFVRQNYTGATIYRCVLPSWDNSARQHNRAFIMEGGTPENYECWLAEAAARTRAERSPGEQLLFINAWNEWAEGCHLEPDRRHARGFLEATLRVKRGISVAAGKWHHLPPQSPKKPPLPPLAVEEGAQPVRDGRLRASTHGAVTHIATKLKRWPTLHFSARALYRLALKRK